VVGVQAVALAEAVRHLGKAERHAQLPTIGEADELGLLQVAEHVKQRLVEVGAGHIYIKKYREGAQDTGHKLDVGAHHARRPDNGAAQLEVHDPVNVVGVGRLLHRVKIVRLAAAAVRGGALSRLAHVAVEDLIDSPVVVRWCRVRGRAPLAANEGGDRHNLDGRDLDCFRVSALELLV